MRSLRQTKFKCNLNKRNTNRKNLIQKMATMLLRERKQHLTAVVRLKAMLRDEREMTNAFLIEMKQILDEIKQIEQLNYNDNQQSHQNDDNVI